MCRFLILFALSFLGYGVYRNPEFVTVMLPIFLEESGCNEAVSKAKDKACCYVLNSHSVLMDAFTSETESLVSDLSSFVTRVTTDKDSVFISASMLYDNAYSLVTQLPDKVCSYSHLSAQNDSVMLDYVSIESQKTPNGVYELCYTVNAGGYTRTCRSRSLDKPHVTPSSISYTLPTGQKYSLCVNEGYISLLSAERIV